MGLARAGDACGAFRAGLDAAPRDAELGKALRGAVTALAPRQLARFLSSLIREAESPPPYALSHRDGTLIKPVRQGTCLTPDEVESNLCSAIGGESPSGDLSSRERHLLGEVRAALLAAWTARKARLRGVVACGRALAYLPASASQAARDVQLARAYSDAWALPSAVHAWVTEALAKQGEQEANEVYSPEVS